MNRAYFRTEYDARQFVKTFGGIVVYDKLNMLWCVKWED